MALKGQTFSTYQDDLKKEIIEKYNSGIPGPRLAKEYGISRFTIATWIRKIKYPELNTGNKRGRQKKLVTLEEYKERYNILKKYQAFLKAQRERK